MCDDYDGVIFFFAVEFPIRCAEENNISFGLNTFRFLSDWQTENKTVLFRSLSLFIDHISSTHSLASHITQSRWQTLCDIALIILQRRRRVSTINLYVQCARPFWLTHTLCILSERKSIITIQSWHCKLLHFYHVRMLRHSNTARFQV